MHPVRHPVRGPVHLRPLQEEATGGRQAPGRHKNLTPAQRDQIVSECVDHMWSPVDLGKKWGCSPDTIRQWVKKAGKVLPKTYKKTEYSESRSSTPGTMKTGNNVAL